MKSGRMLLALAGTCAIAHGQSWDTAGNGLLNGNYYFREVIFTSSVAASLFGNIVFSGSGTYSINAVRFQCTSTSCGSANYQVSGTYSIGSSGFGFLSNGLLGSATIGSVGGNSVFVGSTTENGINDLFIAAPISGQGTSTLQGNYSASYMYPGGQVPYGALLQFSANGAGTFGNVAVAAYATSSTAINQSIGGVKYFVSNNAFVVTFPNSTTNVVTGQEYLYSTSDGSFVFGGSPQDFDMLAGVRTSGGGSTSLGGLYYEAGMDADNSAAASGSVFLDTFYGSFNASNSTVVGHQRLQNGSAAAFGYVYHDTYSNDPSGTYTDLPRSRQYIVSGGVRVGVGIGPFPAVTVAVQAPKQSASGGMFLDPTSGVNAASLAPFTTGISSGELLTLTGTNLGPAAVAFAPVIPLPTTVGGVQVFINNRAVPILTASATQIVVQVPYQTTTSTALIQVAYKGATSNTISTLVNATTPGVFTTPLGGVNRASAHHANRTLVTPSNPAKVGETVTVYLTGLGDLSANVTDGGIGPSVSPAKPQNAFTIYVGGIAVTPSFIGLAPGLIAIGQLSIPIPAGVTTGDVFLDVAGPDSYSSQATIAVTSTSVGNVNRRPAERKSRAPWRVPSEIPSRRPTPFGLQGDYQ